MKYNGSIYRPPVEANTFLLPITEGCTHNSCSFCNMYQDIPFRMLPLNEVEDYLREVRQSYGRICERIRRVYDECSFLNSGGSAVAVNNKSR